MRFSDLRKNMENGDEASNYYGPVQDFNFSGTYDLTEDKKLDLTLGYYNEDTKADYADALTMGKLNKDKKEWYDYKRYDVSLGYSSKTDSGDYMLRTFYSRLNKANDMFYSIVNMMSSTVNPKYDWDKATYILWGVEGKSSQQIGDHLRWYDMACRCGIYLLRIIIE